MPRTVRSEVAKSWQRSAAAGVAIDAADSPITLDSVQLDQVREAHPLALVYPVLEDVLGQAARSCDALLALSDEAGQLLWVTGTNEVLRKAERIGFVEGSNWDERLAGTNAPGLALALGRPAMVRGEEHYRDAVKAWNCVAAPIHDPQTGHLLGVLDITGGPAVAGPQTAALVHTAARLAEAELGRAHPTKFGAVLLPRPDGMRQQSSDTIAPISLEVLGRRQGLLAVGDRLVELSLRHTEVITLLADEPSGLAGDELAVGLYPDEVTSSTIRAEMNRLRSLVGNDVIGSRPYRLRSPVRGDWQAVDERLRNGDVPSALRHYRGPVLPTSDAPAILRLRRRLETDLRRAVLSSARLDLMATWTRSSWGSDDYDVWQAQVDLLPSSSPLASMARAQIERLDQELA